MHKMEIDGDNSEVKQKVPQTSYIRLRGLPYSAKESNVRRFLDGVTIDSVIMTTVHDGRPSGECYCELPSKDDIITAMKYHRNEMESRYIEIFTVSIDELAALKRRGLVTDDGKVVRLRGIPFTSSVQDIKDFFTGLDCEDVVIGRSGGRPSGEAFVRLASRDQVTKALEFNKQHMGTRYVEVFRTTVEDMERHRPSPFNHFEAGEYNCIRHPPPALALHDSNSYHYYGPPTRGTYPYGSPKSRITHSRPAPYDVPRMGGFHGYGGYGYDDFISPTKVFMRGLPFDVDPYTIERFFAPLHCLEISIAFNEDRRPSGDGSVEFGTMAEAGEALGRNKASMGKRYVELFAANDMPPSMRRLTWRVIGGKPAPPPQPLSAPRGYSGGGYGGYGYSGYEQPLKTGRLPPSRHSWMY